jgi:hypothetical protein
VNFYIRHPTSFFGLDELVQEVPYVDERAADPAIALMLDLGPPGVLAVDARVTWQFRHGLIPSDDRRRGCGAVRRLELLLGVLLL